MEDQLYIRKFSLCSPLLFFYFFRTSAVPPFNVTSGVFQKKKQRIFCTTKVTRSDHHWQVAQPSDFVIPRQGLLRVKSRWLAPWSRNEVNTMTKASISTSQGFLFRIFFNEKNQSKWGQVTGFSTTSCNVVTKKSIRWHSHTPPRKLGNHEELAEKEWNRFGMLHVWNGYLPFTIQK